MRNYLLPAVVVGLFGLLPQTLSATTGQDIFLQKCAACHTIGGGIRLGPDLAGMEKRHDEAWLIRWIREPDNMVAEKDPTAIALLQQFNQVPMPNFGLSDAEARAVIDYVVTQSGAQTGTTPASAEQVGETTRASSLSPFEGLGSVQMTALLLFLVLSAAVVAAFWYVAASTRQPVPKIDMESAYRLRRKFFFAAAAMVVGTLAATLPQTPYRQDTEAPDQLVYVAARQFNFVFSSEPITTEADLSQVATIDSLTVPAGALVEFRVTSLDVTHSFGLYGPDYAIVTQTQAMPGYTNRLRVRFTAPGKYKVLCLEYCGLAHHVMQSTLTVL